MIDEQPIPQHPRPQLTLTTIFLIAATVLITLVIAGLAFILTDFGQDLGTLDRSSDASPLMEATSLPATSPQPSTTNGIITGSLSYPSEVIPENMKICAANQATKTETCTDTHLKTEEEPYGVSYKIDVPPGTYLVYAQLPGQTQKAYYSEFVTCGLMAECPSHEPIPVTVAAGETASNVDPHDWYVIEP